MFNTALTVASLFAASSFAAQTPAMDAFKSFASEDGTCLAEYYAPCGAYDTCCDGMQCLNGGDPYHCQFSCWKADGCQNHDPKYGELYCADLSVYGGFCRQR